MNPELMFKHGDDAGDLVIAGLPEPEHQSIIEPPLRVVPCDLNAPIAPIRYVAEPVLPRDVVTLLGGHGGSGKSHLAATIAAHHACGRDWAGLRVVQGRALFLTLEDSADLLRYRLRHIAPAYGLSEAAIERGLTIVDGSGMDGALASEATEYGGKRLVPTAALTQLCELAKGHSLIVVDNASDGFDADENSRRMVRAFIRHLTKIARENNAAVLLLAHIDKNAAKFGAAGNSYSGSTAWHNSCRSRLALVESDGRLELRHEKSNFGPRIEPVPLAWTTDGVLMPAMAESHGTRTTDDDADVLAAIKAAIQSGQDVPTGRTGPANTLQTLGTFPDLPKDMRTRTGKPRFWEAITRLQRAGTIERQTFTTPSRHTKERWIVADSARAPIPTTLRRTGETSAAGTACCDSLREPAKPAKPAQVSRAATGDDYQRAKNGE